RHRAAVANIEHAESVPADLFTACRKAWDDVLDMGEVHGYRNAQASVLAPTGTISFMMDCDTTGVEPDFSLVKSKKLSGGGEIPIHYSGHVRMMGAVQPFISGAISKTVNLPETATVDEISRLWIDAWMLGVKAIAIYRDNCKVAQPLSGKKDATAVATPPVQI